jgi:hypothetical protein
MNSKHELARALIVEADKALKRIDDELHGSDVVIQEQDVVKRAVRHGATWR